MGFLSNYYNRPGPGIPKNAPQKKGLALFFDIFFREFFELVKLNLLFLLFCLPIITIPAALTAASKITVTMVQDQNHFLWSDFVKTFKREFVRSLVAGFLLFLGLLLSGLGVWFYSAAIQKSVFFYIPFGFSLLVVVLLTITGYYVFPMLAAIAQPLKQVLRNAFLLSLICLPYNLIVFAIYTIAGVAAFLFFPISAPFLLIFFFAPLHLVSTFCVWHGLKKYVIQTPTEDA